MRYLVNFLIAIVVTLGGLVAYQKFLLPKQIKKVYVVDTAKIMKIEQKELYLAAKNKDDSKFQIVLDMDKKYQRAIKYIANRDNAIVYLKKAIITGYDKDITNEVLILGSKQ
jgi:hypothetical protein